ncbi:unnamed protein product [Closterium sp. NIES-64]|nr:unnamed protein product [Closterium sp. NIES-64]
MRASPHALPFAPLLTPSPSLPSSRPPLRSPPHALPFAPLLTLSPLLRPCSPSPSFLPPFPLRSPFSSVLLPFSSSLPPFHLCLRPSLKRRPPISAPVAPSGPRFVALCSAPASPTPNLLHLPLPPPRRQCTAHPHSSTAEAPDVVRAESPSCCPLPSITLKAYQDQPLTAVEVAAA